jgi:hypothetical protein
MTFRPENSEETTMSLGSSNSPIRNPFGGGDYAIGDGPVTRVDMPSLMRLVYVWMGIGLAVTAVVAWIVGGQIQALSPQPHSRAMWTAFGSIRV